MSSARLGVAAGVALLLVIGSAAGWYVFHVVFKPGPGCVVTAVSGTGSGDYTLTTTQADSLATMNRWYTVRLDSIWTPVARYLGALPDRYDEGAAYAAYRKAREGSVDQLVRLSPAIKGLLTPAQRRKLPSIVASYLDPRYLSGIRSGTAGGSFNPFGGMGGGVPMGGDGGTRVMIVR